VDGHFADFDGCVSDGADALSRASTALKQATVAD
jgi:hypothetical protein